MAGLPASSRSREDYPWEPLPSTWKTRAGENASGLKRAQRYALVSGSARHFGLRRRIPRAERPHGLATVQNDLALGVHGRYGYVACRRRMT